MNESDYIADQLEREINGEPWHGSSLKNILEGISAQQAAQRPAADAHSIWEILLHMTGWKREVALRAQGNAAAEPPDGDWPAIGEVSDARWHEAREAHLRAQRDLAQLIRELSASQLDEVVKGNTAAYSGAGVPLRTNLYGLLQHDVYHAGQIALLKKIAGGTIRYGL